MVAAAGARRSCAQVAVFLRSCDRHELLVVSQDEFGVYQRREGRCAPAQSDVEVAVENACPGVLVAPLPNEDTVGVVDLGEQQYRAVVGDGFRADGLCRSYADLGVLMVVSAWAARVVSSRAEMRGASGRGP